MNVKVMLLQAPCPGPGGGIRGTGRGGGTGFPCRGSARGTWRPRPARTSGLDDLQPPAAACSQLSGSICMCGTARSASDNHTGCSLSSRCDAWLHASPCGWYRGLLCFSGKPTMT